MNEDLLRKYVKDRQSGTLSACSLDGLLLEGFDDKLEVDGEEIEGEDILWEAVEDMDWWDRRLDNDSVMDEFQRQLVENVRAMARFTCYISGERIYNGPHGYKPKRIPPKTANCSTRHRGRPCKKRR